MRIPLTFYSGLPVTQLAPALLGKVLITKIKGAVTAGRIVETEAYSWVERGCHAFNNRRTARNEVMFGPAGHAYVYLCYGIHSLFNVVTGETGVADAVLVRAVEPVVGEDIMRKRRGQLSSRYALTSGPGKLTVALGINRKHNGIALNGDELWIENGSASVASENINTGERIGMNFPGKDAHLPWRYWEKDNPWVSKN